MTEHSHQRRMQSIRISLRPSDFHHAGKGAPFPRQTIRLAWTQVYGRLFGGVLATLVSIAACRRRRRLLFLSMSNTLYRGSTVAPTIRAASRSPATAATHYKGPNLTSIDPDTHTVAALFNPRGDAWSDHFAVRGGHILGLTPTGRATVRLLNMNAPRRVELRENADGG